MDGELLKDAKVICRWNFAFIFPLIDVNFLLNVPQSSLDILGCSRINHLISFGFSLHFIFCFFFFVCVCLCSWMKRTCMWVLLLVLLNIIFYFTTQATSQSLVLVQLSPAHNVICCTPEAFYEVSHHQAAMADITESSDISEEII